MKITVEVVYAMPQAQTVIELGLEEGATVEDALRVSGIIEQHPQLDLASCRLGIWGRVAARSQILKHRDRVEIYRPLLADPKQARRRRAERERKRGR
jgi:putative ubiquitin-RnfH superfamily antitoxin RatB of RatAB toxin-antitoxin module